LSDLPRFVFVAADMRDPFMRILSVAFIDALDLDRLGSNGCGHSGALLWLKSESRLTQAIESYFNRLVTQPVPRGSQSLRGKSKEAASSTTCLAAFRFVVADCRLSRPIRANLNGR
jgi:hypothetical protein